MDLLTTRPRHRKPPPPPTNQKRRPNSTNTTPQNSKPPQRRPSTGERRPVPQTNVPKIEIDVQKRIEPQRPPPIQRKPLVETKQTSTQTELLLIEKKLYDSLLHTVDSTLEIIQKNLQRILNDKCKNIEESHAKLIEDILGKVDAKKHPKYQENKKVLEAKLRDYKNFIKQKHKFEKEQAKSEKGEKGDPLRLKRQFSLEKLTKLSLGLKHSTQESVETPKLKRQYSFENSPTKHQDAENFDQTPNNTGEISDLRSRLTKVMDHFKSTEVLNSQDEDLPKKEEDKNHVFTEPVASFPLENQEPKSPLTENEDSIFSDNTILLNNESPTQEELILPPENFQENPYNTKRDQELEYLKSLKGKLSSLAIGHRTSESSSESSFQEKSTGKKSPFETKKIKEIKTKLTQLLDSLKAQDKFEYDKAEKRLLKLKVKYVNIRFIQDDEFQTLRSEVLHLFNEAERIMEGAKHGLAYSEGDPAPRSSITSESSSLDVSGNEASCTESPYVKLERMKIMLEQMVSDIEESEILNYDLILNELNKYQVEFSDIRTQLMPESGPIRQEVLNLLIQAYNLLEDKSRK